MKPRSCSATSAPMTVRPRSSRSRATPSRPFSTFSRNRQMISGTRYRLDLQIARQSSLAAEIARGQTEIAAGKRILAPSDDPIGSAPVADMNRLQDVQTIWQRNLNTASALAAQADTILGSVATGIDRAKELMLTAAN